MKFIYTEPALQELQMFQKRQQKILEELIAERKFVYGDDNIEVTASDIKEASIYIRAYRPRVSKYSKLRLISQIYILLGILITSGAFFYPKFQTIFRENSVQAFALITGVFITFLGIIAAYIYRLRIRQYGERIISINNDKDRID
jgi:hypothetical protein